eukprot:366399-Chlamydomonas_euryale.AAC.14
MGNANAPHACVHAHAIVSSVCVHAPTPTQLARLPCLPALQHSSWHAFPVCRLCTTAAGTPSLSAGSAQQQLARLPCLPALHNSSGHAFPVCRLCSTAAGTPSLSAGSATQQRACLPCLPALQHSSWHAFPVCRLCNTAASCPGILEGPRDHTRLCSGISCAPGSSLPRDLSGGWEAAHKIPP